MTVTINSAILKDGIIKIYAENTDELRLQRLERNREDDFAEELEFLFDTHEEKSLKYIRNWLRKQKVIQQAMKDNKNLTWKDVIDTISDSGITTLISGRYINRVA